MNYSEHFVAAATLSPSVQRTFTDDDGGGGEQMTAVQAGNLSDVPEEDPATRSPSPRSPYLASPANPATTSTSTLTSSPTAKPQLRKPSSLRNVWDPSSREPHTSPTVHSKRNPSPSSKDNVKSAKTNGTSSTATTTSSTTASTSQRIRNTPRLPHDHDVEPAPATLMYWSRAPVFGAIPMRGMRAHTVNLVDNVAWLFGGCDEKGCSRDIYCFDTETMQWSHPDTLGDLPPPCRAHTATLVDRKIVIFGGGQGPVYYNSVFILDTVTRRWVRPNFHSAIPATRRAHAAVYYRGKIWIFGGGNGMHALNDVWTLDVNVPVDKMRWKEIETRGRKPAARGYHTANLVGNVMVIVGGSDGKECFSDIWCLNLDTLVWSQVSLEVSHRRLSHTATQVGSYLFIIGGHDGTQYTSDVLMFNLVSLQYEPRSMAGKSPSPRGYHCALLADSRVFVFGGYNSHDVFDDVFVLDLAGAAYLPQGGRQAVFPLFPRGVDYLEIFR